MDDNFKGNSFAQKKRENELPEKKTITPVTTNVTVKEGNGGIFKKKIFSEDASSVGKCAMDEVLIPKTKNLIVELIKYCVDFIFYGKNGISNPNGRGYGTVVSYNDYYHRTNSTTYGQQPAPQVSYNRPAMLRLNDIIFNDRGEAELTLTQMRGTLSKYGSVSVGDFYDFVGQKSAYTDYKYGWRDLATASVVRCNGGGYAIDFPKIVPLEN